MQWTAQFCHGKNEIDYSNIYCMKIDGTGKTLVSDAKEKSSNSSFVLCDGQVIAKNTSRHLCRISSSGEKLSLSVAPADYWLAGEWIYYTQYNQSANRMDLYRINTDGQNRMLVTARCKFSGQWLDGRNK